MPSLLTQTPPAKAPMTWGQTLAALEQWRELMPEALIVEVRTPLTDEDADIPEFWRTTGFTARVVKGAEYLAFKTSEGVEVTL